MAEAQEKPKKIRNMFGRRVLKHPAKAITSDNVVQALNDVLPEHMLNAAEIAYLMRYYRGDQPILRRTKEVRPEICNQIEENHAYEIVSFKTGYVFGEPIQYVQRGEREGVSEKIARLNEYMFSEDKAAKDKELAELFSVCGTSYRMVLPDAMAGVEPDESPFEMDVLDPATTFVVYSTRFGRKPLLGCMIQLDEDKTPLYCAYTEDAYFEIKNNEIIKQEPHAMGMVPIIEYPANSLRIGEFEVVLTITDALNNLVSNRMDGLEQFVQAFMKFVNCEIDEPTFKEMIALGAVMIKGQQGLPADVDLVTSQLDQTQTQVSKNDLYRTMLIICGMPDRNGSASGGDTGQAVILRDGWSSAESRARDTELIFKKSERQFLQLALRIVDGFAATKLGLLLSDIDIKFTRNRTDALLTKTQGMQSMLESGIHPLVAITTAGLFSDPQQVYLDSQDYLKKWDYHEPVVTPSNNKPDDPDEGGDPPNEGTEVR